MNALLLFAAVMLAGNGQSHGERQPVEQPGLVEHLDAIDGAYFLFPSEAVGRNYHIYVRTPEDDGAGAPYPVVYLLDGDSTFPMLAPTHLFSSYDDGIPEALIVGIAYGNFGDLNKRHIDFTDSATDENPEGGGSSRFDRFLQGELAPFIESRFDVDPKRRILFGQSRGGNYILHSAFTDPDFFWARIASNPSTWPDASRYLEAPGAAERDDLQLFYISGTKDRPALREDAARWFTRWKGAADAPWKVHAIDLDGGTHAADAPRAYREAMTLLFPVVKK